MRVNQFVAHATGMSRRAADRAIADGRITINTSTATTGCQVTAEDTVLLDGASLHLPRYRLIAFNKPVGYITSRTQQGNTPTIYSLLPEDLTTMKPVGRLDKESSGLLLMTNDGALAQTLQHPSSRKWKRYEVTTHTKLTPKQVTLLNTGVELNDGISTMVVTPLEGRANRFEVRLQEGRNRQIRRSFEAIDSRVARLHRTDFGPYTLGDLEPGLWREQEVLV